MIHSFIFMFVCQIIFKWFLLSLEQRCRGRLIDGQRRCCTPENPCDEGEGDCDGELDGGTNDGNDGCKGDLVCGSNNCEKFGPYFHANDDCCERPSELDEFGEWSEWTNLSECEFRNGRMRRRQERTCSTKKCKGKNGRHGTKQNRELYNCK